MCVCVYFNVCFSIHVSGTELTTSVSVANLHSYSVWDEHLMLNIGLVKDNEDPPPSLLLLWLAEAQARRLTNDLSVLQTETRPGETHDHLTQLH